MVCSLLGSSVRGVFQARILEWVAISFSWGSSQLRDQTHVCPHCWWVLYQLSHKGNPKILEWVAYPFPRGLPNPGFKPGSPTLQADSLPTELSGKGWLHIKTHLYVEKGAEGSFIQKAGPSFWACTGPLDRLLRAQAPPDSCGKGEALPCPPELRTRPQRPPAP